MAASSDATYEQPHVLIGIDDFKTPAQARQAMQKPGAERFSSDRIKTDLRLTATIIYNHLKLAPRFKHKTEQGANALAYFVCAAYGQEAPSNDELLTRSAYGEMRPFKLCHWDSLYYALVAEIRALYDDIQRHYETEYADGALVLHRHGWDGTEDNSPWTALQLAAQLECMWLLLMDPLLLGPLDEAVRIEQFADQFRNEFGDEFRTKFKQKWEVMSPEEATRGIENAPGMIDTHSMSPADIMDMLWQKQMPLVRRACRENFDKDVQFQVRLAEYRLHPFIEDIPADQLEDITCSCVAECGCRMACQYECSTCACKENRNQIRRTVWWQEKVQEKAQAHFTNPPEVTRMLGAATNDMAQLQIAAMANPSPHIMQAIQATHHTENQNMQNTRPQPSRNRSNTNRSDLAYVPAVAGTPRRNKKDPFSLALYENKSPGRYPAFRPETSNQPQPIYGAACYSDKIPSRKPVPDRLSIATAIHTGDENPQKKSPLYSPAQFDGEPASSPTSVTYPRIPKSTSQDLFTSSPPQKPINERLLTQSFPVVAAGNPREPENEFAYWDDPEPDSPDLPTMPSYVFAQAAACNTPPKIRHSADSPQTRGKVKGGSSPAEKPLALPVQALPDFIAPRPALKQRYVSAGGNIPLKDRPPIEFDLPASHTPGATMSREEMMRLCEEAGISRRDSAVHVPRSSQENGEWLNKSQRSSRDIDELVRGEKRGRTSSTSSFRKMKRVFSRKNSQSD